MTTDQLRARRAKLVELVTRGIDGERSNAQAMLERFDKAHPEVKSAPPPRSRPVGFSPENVVQFFTMMNAMTIAFDLFFVNTPPVKRKRTKRKKKGVRATRDSIIRRKR